MHLASGPCHSTHNTVAGVPFIIISKPRVDISRLGIQSPSASHPLPGEQRPEGILPLTVLKLKLLRVVCCKQREFSVRIYMLKIYAKEVSAGRPSVKLLQNMQVSEGTALVTLCWIVLANNIVLGVIDILLLVVIPVFEGVLRGGEHNT